MRKTNFKILLFVLLTVLFPFSCGLGSGNEDGNENDSISEEGENGESLADATTICIWSSVTVKETPEQKGKYKNTIYLGEKTQFLGKTQTDSSDKKNVRDYIRIRLTDGTEGWVQANLMSIGGKPYAVKETTKLYKRPDILSVGKDEFEKMQFVIAIDGQEEWVKVKGKKKTDSWFKEGWVKLDRLTEIEVDITVAILAERALSKETDEKKLEALKEITDNTDLSTSIFIFDVRAMVEEYNTPEEPTEYIEGD
jgi:hypothetical protein